MSYKFELITTTAYLQLLALENPEDNKAILKVIDLELQKDNKLWIIDLAALSYINSTGLNLLIAALAKVRAKSGEIILVGISPNIQQVLVLTRLQTFFVIKDTTEAALAIFKKNEENIV